MTLFEVVKNHPGMIGHIQQSVYNTLKVYASSEIVPKPHFYKSHANDFNITVIGTVNITGKTNTSVLSLGFSNEVFISIYENMFQEKLTGVSSDTADLAGELVNIIFQSIDPELRKLGYMFDTSLPEVLIKSNHHKWVSISVEQSLVLPFTTGGGDLLFEVFETKG